MGLLRQARRYFFRKPNLYCHVPRQYINPGDDIRVASRDEVLLIRSGHARTPGEARRLLKGGRAVDYIYANPRIPRNSTPAQRFVFWVMRLQGSQLGNPYKLPKSGRSIPIEYRYEEKP